MGQICGLEDTDSSITSNTMSNDISPSSLKQSESSQSPQRLRGFDYRNQLIIASQYVLNKVGGAPIAIVLGSGLGNFSKELHDVKELKYSEIPFLPTASVKGHSSKIIIGSIKSKDGKTIRKLMCFAGRLHAYEGIPMPYIVFCSRLAYLCGAHTLILTNAAGGCVPNQKPGSVVILNDYIRDCHFNVLKHSARDSMFGVKYLRTDNLFDTDVSNVFINTAKKLKFTYYHGTYWWTSGPFYETKSQTQFCMNCKVSSVGMSTVPSILAGKNIGLRVCAMSLCTNVAAGIVEDEILTHDVVCENAKAANVGFSNFVKESLLQIDDPDEYKINEGRQNIEKLDMFNGKTSDFKNIISPRKHLSTYHDLYIDIKFVRSFLNKILDEETHKIENKNGPIPIWILHDPFKFDLGSLMCPISMPLGSLDGFDKILTSSSAGNAILNFGFDAKSFNFIVIITGLELEGFSFDESNYFINLLHGTMRHKNLCFINIFYAFPTKTLYDKKEEDKDDEKHSNESMIKREKYFVINDSVDFNGGFPRFPFPLFPPTENNENSNVDMNKFIFNDDDNDDDNKDGAMNRYLKKITSYNIDNVTYAYWMGPNIPTRAEANMSDMARCQVIGATNPCMTPICRSLGHLSYSITYIPSIKDFDILTGPKPQQLVNDITDLIYNVTNSIITERKAINTQYTDNIINDDKLQNELYGLNVPQKTPQFQLIHTVENEWKYIENATEYLQNVWDFKKTPVIHALFSSFCLNDDEMKKKSLISIDLQNVPGWKEHFCGGYPYSHYHWNDINPFKWTLNIYQITNTSTDICYYFLVSPNFDKNSLNGNLYKFYKYTPRFWNLSFIIRVLWKLGIKNICFFNDLFRNNINVCNDNDTLQENEVIALSNYIECSRWNILMGPNDDRMGPRFIPITVPLELKDNLLEITTSQQLQIKSVLTVHIPSSAVISKATSIYYGYQGYQTKVLGLIPCIQTSQHLSLKKCCIAITDYQHSIKLKNIDSFSQILQIIETMFYSLK